MRKLIKLSIVLFIGVLVFTGCSDKNDTKLDKDSEKRENIKEDSKVEKDPGEENNQDSEGTKTMTCKRAGTITTGVTADLTYEVTYTDLYVDKIHTVEKLMSENVAYLNLYKQKVEEGYSSYKDLEYYNYDITIKDGVLTSVVDIDYSKIDTNKMIEIDPNNATLIKDGKIKVSDMKILYHSTGAVCD